MSFSNTAKNFSGGSGMSALTTVTMDSNSDGDRSVKQGTNNNDSNDMDEGTDFSPLPVDISFDPDSTEGLDRNSVETCLGFVGSTTGGAIPSSGFRSWDIVAKEREIHFLKQELARAHQQLHIVCLPRKANHNMVSKGHAKKSKDRVGSYGRTAGGGATIDTVSSPLILLPGRSSHQQDKEERQKIEHELILDPYGDQGTYTGMILKSTRMPHGTGRMEYMMDSGDMVDGMDLEGQGDERIYDGQWRHGRWHGFGRADFANGDSYEGDYKMDQRHGYGKYTWEDGRSYDGLFDEDRRQGEGFFVWPDGSIYEGGFLNGQRDGHGTYTYSDGNRYSGGWKGGKFHGYGALSRGDGSCHCGNWCNGFQHGNGIETSADGSVRHDGRWVDGEPIREKKGPSKRPSEVRSTPTSTRRRCSTRKQSKGKSSH